VILMHIPPLRERRSDIPQLCSHLMKTIAGGQGILLPDAEYAKLSSYDWPGNVRELKNILERAYLLQNGGEFRPADLLGKTRQPPQTTGTESDADAPLLPLEEVEMRHIRHALGRLSGNYTQAAKALGISLSTLKRKLKTNN
jgi:transcriptional regulator with PAS, ATPase and Fis domain